MGARGGPGEGRLSALPAVHELAAELDGPHGLAVAAARDAIKERREAILAGAAPAGAASAPGSLVPRARALLVALQRSSPGRVLNATGVIVHTNLGRAPLAVTARESVARAAHGYCDLELDLDTGARGSRQAHVQGLLRELTGAQAAIAVNNGAAAVLLAAAALAGPGRAIVVSRGQLVEIGGGFRIPEVIAQSGSELVEVGTTNRTRLGDYQRALDTAQTPVGAILRVHQSNFRTLGFVQEVAIEELCGLGPPVIDDVGSGVLAGPGPGPGAGPGGLAALGDEPPLRRSVAAGAALVCCSGDKLLGGPQAGLLLGRDQAVAAAREHPLARALRIDKLSLAALVATLVLYRDPDRARREIPVLAMLGADEGTLQTRAGRLREAIGAGAVIVRASGRVGGGALPLLELEGPAVALETARDPVTVAGALRAADPPVIARIHEGRVLLDPRTLGEDELELVARAARDVLQATPPGGVPQATPGG